MNADTRTHTHARAQVAEAAKDGTLLIHEATFEDEMQAEAVGKRHSTTGEAMGIAEQVCTTACTAVW